MTNDEHLIADIDAEKAVLGSCMSGPAVVGYVLEILAGPDDFVRPQHRMIWDALLDLYGRGLPTDPIALKDRLERRGDLNRAGGAAYLADLYGFPPVNAQVDHHAGIVAALAYRRRTKQQLVSALQAIENPVSNVAEIVAGLGDLPTGVGPARGRRIRLTRASEIEPAPVIWAWEDDGKGRIPAGAFIVGAGREGTGKSSFGKYLVSHITRGTLPGSLQGTPYQAVYAAVEDSWKYTIVPRLIAAGADLERVYRVEVYIDEDETTTLSLPSDLGELEEVIVSKQVGIVVLDPLMSMMGSSIDTHRNREVRSALDPLAALAERTGAVILGIAHFNKGSGTDASSLITGSGAFKDVPRAVFGFARDSENGDRVMTQTKNSLGYEDLPSRSYRMVSAKVETKTGVTEVGRFVLDGESDRRVQDILGDTGTSEDRAERDEAAEWLRDVVERQGEMPANDVYKAGATAGFSKDTLKRAKPKAGVCSRKPSFGTGWVWALTSNTDDEGSTKGAKSAGNQTPTPFAPFVLPSGGDDNVTPLFKGGDQS